MKKEKKNKKKREIKLKKIWILLLVLFILLIGGLSFFFIQNMRKDTLKQLKKKYNPYVITITKAKLYDKN